MENNNLNKTEQDYIEMANHAKELLQEKEEEIKALKHQNKGMYIAIKKMKRLIKSLTESVKKTEFLVDFHKQNVGNIMKFFYGNLQDLVQTTVIELDEANVDSDDSNNEEEEDYEEDSLSLQTILSLLGEPIANGQLFQNQ